MISKDIQSYEMLASIVIILCSFFSGLMPEVQICAISIIPTGEEIPCSIYPGAWFIGTVGSTFLLGFGYILRNETKRNYDSIDFL